MLDLVPSIGNSILAIAVVIGAALFVHELGHFLMAKLMGIPVPVFSLGFGLRILGWKRGDTDYRLSLVPLGGYVKMLGEHPEDDLQGSPDEFMSRSRFERFLVYAAGPAMNIVLAFILFSTVFTLGVREPAALHEPPVIGRVAEETPAAAAGFQAGDRILEADGTPMPSLPHPHESLNSMRSSALAAACLSIPKNFANFKHCAGAAFGCVKSS